MGCTKSKIDPKICERDETHSMQEEFIKKHGLEKYYQTLGMEQEHSGLNGGHEQKFIVLKINKMMSISLPHTQDIMF